MGLVIENEGRASSNGPAVVDACVAEADALFLSGTHHCAEAVVSVIRSHFRPDLPEDIVGLVGGLGGGCDVGCICGALSGATIALGMVFPQDRERVTRMTRDMHHWFKETYGTACCRALQHKREPGCRVDPGAVAGKLAEALLTEGASGS